MKISMALTLDGMLRALRWRAHNVAEEMSLTGRRTSEVTPLRPAKAGSAKTRTGSNDRARR